MKIFGFSRLAEICFLVPEGAGCRVAGEKLVQLQSGCPDAEKSQSDTSSTQSDTSSTQQGAAALFLYYRISFVLSVLALAAWTFGVAAYEAPRAGDGYGPDPLGVLLYLAIWPVGLLLAHSGLLACLVRARQPATILQGRQGIPIHLALGAGFLAYALYQFYPG
ncbi:hypothetical protein [Achromobacter anxifer]|uniref:hypothetical protein n=1 Tax=Achromobacter anxifer TaxID=1287737 RepID=UPI001FECF0A0|nr:hypothetical protein [Achromobacter anxifer]MDF8360827.1 hypothetical protein [Achromobacter anxifer]